MRRSGGDDAAPTAPLHTWNGCTDRMEGGGQVDREYRVPLIDWKFLDWRDVLDARVINEHIDAAERLLGKRDHLGDFARLSHVRGRIDSLHPEIILDRGSFLLNVGRHADAIKHDVGPGACKRTRTRETYPACRARHNRRLTFQNTHFRFPCWFLAGAPKILFR